MSPPKRVPPVRKSVHSPGFHTRHKAAQRCIKSTPHQNSTASAERCKSTGFVAKPESGRTFEHDSRSTWSIQQTWISQGAFDSSGDSFEVENASGCTAACNASRLDSSRIAKVCFIPCANEFFVSRLDGYISGIHAALNRNSA